MCWTYIVASPTVMSSPRSMTAEGVYRLYAPRTATALPSQDILPSPTLSPHPLKQTSEQHYKTIVYPTSLTNYLEER